jgi:hypothetical protein
MTLSNRTLAAIRAEGFTNVAKCDGVIREAGLHLADLRKATPSDAVRDQIAGLEALRDAATASRRALLAREATRGTQSTTLDNVA